MRFSLIDRITGCQPGKSLTAVKQLTQGEEYLADHFPSFPVMPGVLMLEAVVEASAWLWRLTSDFAHSVIVLREARNVKYGTFMQPGHTMDLTVELVKQDGASATFRGKGTIRDGGQAVSAQVSLAAYNVRDRNAAASSVDERLMTHWRERYRWLSGEIAKIQG